MRLLPAAALAAGLALLPPVPATAVCTPNVCVGEAHCTATYNYCPGAVSCAGFVNFCPGAGSCSGGVNVCDVRVTAEGAW
ncbi:MAG TPA: hypothetical protein VF519_11670 [Mycobacteriales bacterium]|jgi:hypothetical protein